VAATSSATDANESTDHAPDPVFYPSSPAELLQVFRTPSRDGLAFLISALSSPFLVCAAAGGALAIKLASSWHEVALWGAMGSVLAGVVPFVVVFLLFRRGKVGDIHVAERERRWVPLGAAMLSGVLGLAALRAMGTPLQLQALGGAYLANATAFALVSLFWKVSVHAGVFSGALAACALVVSPWWWMGLTVVPLVIWARCRRGRHTLGQGIVGTALATVVTVVAYCGIAGL
jgi:hypothetical protein